MVNAFRAGTVVAVVAGLIGWFMILRKQTFAGHTLALIGFPGAAGAVLIVVVIGAAALGAMAVMGRPLLFATIDAEVAATRRVPVRALSLGFLLLLGLTAAACTQLTGALLVLALLVLPAATAQTLTM